MYTCSQSLVLQVTSYQVLLRDALACRMLLLAVVSGAGEGMLACTSPSYVNSIIIYSSAVAPEQC